jgi:hypothetical protein
MNSDSRNSHGSDDSLEDPSLLHTAVKLGDFIRQHVRARAPTENTATPSSSNDNHTSTKGLVERIIDPSASTTPGMMEGFAVAIVTAGLLTPVRRTVLRATMGTPLAVFTDLLASSSLVIAALMSGMYVGSLVGSTTYLQQLAQVSTEGTSPMADEICQSDLMKDLLKRAHRETAPLDMSSPSSYMLGERDPRHQAIHVYQRDQQGETSMF